MNRNSLIHKASLALLAFLALLGCEVADKNVIPMPDKPYQLKHEAKPFVVEFNHPSSILSPEEKARLLLALKPSGPGKVSVHLTIPNKGSPLGRKRLKHIIRTALEAGVKAKQIHRSNQLPSARDSFIQVILDVYRAIPPLCPNWSMSHGTGYDRGNTSNMGCSTAANFLLMIDDPIILFKGDSAPSRDAARDSLSIADHRLGKDKGKWLKVETNSSSGSSGSGSSSSSGSSGSSGIPGSGGAQ